MHTNTHTHMQTHIHMQTHTYVHAHARTHTHAHTHTHIMCAHAHILDIDEISLAVSIIICIVGVFIL